MKVTLQWKDGDVWREVKCELRYSRNGNMFVKHDGKVYVFPNLKEDNDVVTKIDGKWEKAGRVTSGVIFLGEGESYREYNHRMYLERKARGESRWIPPKMS